MRTRKIKQYHPSILTCDPGSVNWAWAVMPGDNPNGNVSESGMLPRLQEFTAEEITAWNAISYDLMWGLRGKVEMFFFERYHIRGSGSKNNEVINILIGCMINHALSIGMKLGEFARPTDWKSALKRAGADWHLLYPDLPTEHTRDAAGLGLYNVEKRLYPGVVQNRIHLMGK